MSVEPPRKITGTQIIRREEETGRQQKKNKQPQKKGPEPGGPEKTGRVDIKV